MSKELASKEQCLNSIATAMRAARIAMQDLIDIGKRDLRNPKYDGYFEALREAIVQIDSVEDSLLEVK